METKADNESTAKLRIFCNVQMKPINDVLISMTMFAILPLLRNRIEYLYFEYMTLRINNVFGFAACLFVCLWTDRRSDNKRKLHVHLITCIRSITTMYFSYHVAHELRCSLRVVQHNSKNQQYLPAFSHKPGTLSLSLFFGRSLQPSFWAISDVDAA